MIFLENQSAQDDNILVSFIVLGFLSLPTMTVDPSFNETVYSNQFENNRTTTGRWNE